ncbi:MAG: hypothetical protein JWN00_6222 [Actinomycetia bacterium]|nr:hypothetical protein [Actinomycetes bacterium]
MTATLILLYAQPITRILRLTTDDLVNDPEENLTLRLGTPPTGFVGHVVGYCRANLKASFWYVFCSGYLRETGRRP